MLQTLVLSVTYQCPIQCKFCGVNASPYRKERMSLDFIKRMIDEVYSYGVARVVVFTGGEPFLLGEDLFSAVHYATQKGFLTRIVTNCFWATSLNRATKILSRLQELGLNEINYSCDDFHQQYVPLANVKYANEAANALGLPALLAMKGIKGSAITPTYVEKFFGVKLTAFRCKKDSPKNNIYNYGVTVPVGWGSEFVNEYEDFCIGSSNAWKRACFSPLNHIVITPSGKLAICCGIGSDDIPETIIGDVHEKPLIQLLEEANNDLIVNWLALEGPYGILKFIQDKSPDTHFSERYVNVCHLCHEIFTRADTRAVLQDAAEKTLSISLKRVYFEQHREEIWNNVIEQDADM